MLFFYLEGRTYTVPEVGTLLQRRLHCFYRDPDIRQAPTGSLNLEHAASTWHSHVLAKTLALGFCTLE
jgi:hypothetical protein